jgi:alpha-tubulin suppressor-like RCC1 family protein
VKKNEIQNLKTSSILFILFGNSLKSNSTLTTTVAAGRNHNNMAQMEKTIIKSVFIGLLCWFGGFNSMDAQSIAAGSYSSTFVCADGTAQAAGDNQFGQLGIGTGISTSNPAPVALTGITAVAGIGDHRLFVKNDGTAWGTGYNHFGQLGNGTISNTYTPMQAVGITGITAVAGGQVHSLFLKNDGTVWAAGNNAVGQLGDGTTLTRSTPVQVSGLTGIISIAAGYNHSLFLKSDGTVWAVGSNQFGQLGEGGSQDMLTLPVQVLGLTGITVIAGGQWHSLFLKNDGTVWSVGSNSTGQLGDGTFLGKSTPLQIPTLTGITAIAAGYNQSYFIKNDGTVWASGRNQSGALGDGTNSNRPTPVQVVGLTGIIAAAAGGLHAIFLKNDATVWSVGLNANGQLGDGTTTDKSIAVQVPALCSALGTAETASETAIAVYPNPCSEQLFIESAEYQNTTATIFNLQGQLLHNISLTSFKTTLQTNNLASGVYLVQVNSPQGTLVKKIVKH